MSDPIHQRDNTQSTLVSLKFISYFNSHFYTSIVIVTHEPFAFTPRERGKYSQTTFNLWASVLAEILQLSTAYVLSELFRWMLSKTLRRGRTIPVEAMGRLPGGLIDSFHVAKAMKWAPPSVFIVVLFASDYATTIAFAGLGFETTSQRGPEEPVLSLQMRNNAIPYEAIGDPVTPRTISKLDLLLGQTVNPKTAPRVQMLAGESGNNFTDKFMLGELAKEQSVVSSFLGAVDAIARGESVFLDQNDLLQRDPASFVLGQSTDVEGLNGTESVVLFARAPSFLTAVNLSIPLECDGFNHSTDKFMLEIMEERGNRLDFKAISKIPNCNVLSPRSSGIFDKEHVDLVKITSYASSQLASLYMQASPNETILSNKKFAFPVNGLPLARDRTVDFRKGREVFGFGGVKFGKLDIPLGYTTVASGLMVQGFTRQYKLVSQIDPTDCPKDPSQTVNSTCLAVTSLECDLFSTEEEQPFPTSTTKYCELVEVELLWGTNFEVDSQLIAAIAGVHGRNAGWANSRQQKQTLTLHSVQAALFMLGSIESSASNEAVQSTSIDAVFIAFMCLPVGMCLIAGLVFLLGMKQIVQIPDDGCKMMQMGAERAATLSDAQCSIVPEYLHIALVGERLVIKEIGLETGSKDQDSRTHDLSSVGRDLTVVLKDNGLEEEPKEQSSRTHVQSSVGRDLTEDQGHGSRPFDNSIIDERDTANSTSPCQNQGHCSIRDSDDQDNCDSSAGSEEGGDRTASSHPPTSSSTAAADDDDPPHPNRDTKTDCEDDRNSDDSGCCEHDGEDGEPTSSSCSSEHHSGLHLVQDMPEDDCDGNQIQNDKDQDKHSSRKGNGDGGPNDNDLIPGKSQEDIHSQEISKVKNSIYVVGCIIFSISMLILGSIFVKLTSFSDTQSSQGIGSAKIRTNDLQLGLMPDNCFRNRFDLQAAVSAHFDGPLDKYDKVLEEYGPIEDWCVDYIEDFSYLFTGRKFVDEDISTWNVSSGRSFSHCFLHSSFEGDLTMWDVSQSTDFSGMFERTPFFNGSISKWNVSSGRDFSKMFYWAESFNSDLSSWNVSHAQDFSFMFANTKASNIDLSRWDVSHVIWFKGQFSEARYTGDLSSWDVSRGVDFSEMF